MVLKAGSYDLSLQKPLSLRIREQLCIDHSLERVSRQGPFGGMRRVEVLLERTERESVPMGSGAGLGELGHLLPDRSQHKNLAVWLKAKANSVETALVVSGIEQVGLIEDAKFLLLVYVGRPLGGFRSTPSMVLLVEKVSITAALCHMREETTRFTAD
jgi:hypothetical protein